MFIANYNYLENILKQVGRRCQVTVVLFSLAPCHNGIDPSVWEDDENLIKWRHWFKMRGSSPVFKPAPLPGAIDINVDDNKLSLGHWVEIQIAIILIKKRNGIVQHRSKGGFPNGPLKYPIIAGVPIQSEPKQSRQNPVNSKLRHVPALVCFSKGFNYRLHV